jgi:hypothetical protein
MKSFSCSACGHKVYFENFACVRCGHALGFDTELQSMIAMDPEGGEDGTLYRRLSSQPASVRYCANSYFGVCNWLTPADHNALCRACNLNRTIPNLSEPGSLEAWKDLERAKKRLV